MDVLNRYFEFLGVLNAHFPHDISKRKRNDPEAMHCLQQLISTANDLMVNYFITPRLEKFGLPRELAAFCKAMNLRQKETLLAFSKCGVYKRLSVEMDNRLYHIATCLCAHAMAEEAIFIHLKMASTKCTAQLSIGADVPCFRHMDTPEEIMVAIAADLVKRTEGVLNMKRSGSGKGLVLRVGTS
ncbi:MAG: hypothetical protein AAF693_21830 [Bacteroidota bacterium]